MHTKVNENTALNKVKKYRPKKAGERLKFAKKLCESNTRLLHSNLFCGSIYLHRVCFMLFAAGRRIVVFLFYGGEDDAVFRLFACVWDRLLCAKPEAVQHAAELQRRKREKEPI